MCISLHRYALKRRKRSWNTGDIILNILLKCSRWDPCAAVSIHIGYLFVWQGEVSIAGVWNDYYKYNSSIFISGYHRHEGCTKDSRKMKAVFKRPGMSEVKTDYQQTYTLHETTKPRNARKPLPRLRNPNPPPMDFRTVQRMDFVERKSEPQGLCKVWCYWQTVSMEKQSSKTY